MNTIALKIIMIKNGDNGLTLSRYLGISRSTLSAKMSKNSKSEFTQNEILKIKKNIILRHMKSMKFFLILWCLKKILQRIIKSEKRTCRVNTNVMRCIEMEDKKIVKEIQLGATKIKFSDEFVAKTKEQRKLNIQIFKRTSERLIESVINQKI